MNEKVENKSASVLSIMATSIAIPLFYYDVGLFFSFVLLLMVISLLLYDYYKKSVVYRGVYLVLNALCLVVYISLLVLIDESGRNFVLFVVSCTASVLAMVNSNVFYRDK